MLIAIQLSPLLLNTATDAQAQRFSSRGLTFRDRESKWVDSVMNTMTLEQRVAQLMVVRVPLDMSDRQAREFSDRMNGFGVGGVCFFAGTAERQVAMTRRFQKDAAVPLLVCIDGEWGLGMRLKDMYSFPRNARFGKLDPADDSLVYRMGAEIGRQCREMGIHINFAPVVDINSNPKNPVIGTRSFGTDRERVAQLGVMFALGLQSQGVIATAKHFPGHGDTDKDSHLELPVINHSPAYIDSVDTYPFKRMIEAGVGGVMVAHLQVRALDAKRPSSLSPVIVDTLLRRILGFDGLIITDGLDMKGVTNTYADGNGELAALVAGNDILLLPPDVEKAIGTIVAEARRSEAVKQMVDDHCHRVLQAKYRYVIPHVGEPLQVPGEEHLQLCRDIVTELNLKTDTRIDSVVRRAIAEHAMPGCQIYAMHHGRVIIDRCYGHLTYDSTAAPVTPETVYDLASLTKVTATTLAVMRLYDMGKIKLDDRLSRYLPYLKNTDKERITIKQALSHCAGLKAFDALWRQVGPLAGPAGSADSSVNVRDSILTLVAHSQLNADASMVYSDFGFMLLGDLVQRLSGMPMEQFVAEQFYEPMGLLSTTFNPLDNNFDPRGIAPTELDTLRGLIRGTVHDPNAFAMGGVSGHAGLFSTAADVAQLMQMLLNGGQLDGHRYLKQKTVETFTKRHFERQGNRRALGFDKQLFTPSSNGQTCPAASQNSFGHTGFTGTMVWVDPDYDLVYVFLSNRVHPSASPNKLAQMNVRTDIQSVIYDIISK